LENKKHNFATLEKQWEFTIPRNLQLFESIGFHQKMCMNENTAGSLTRSKPEVVHAPLGTDGECPLPFVKDQLA
jgi:hypothetical protein